MSDVRHRDAFFCRIGCQRRLNFYNVVLLHCRGVLQKVQEQTSPSSSQSAASDEDPPGPTVRVGAEGIGGEGRDRGDILKEKPHLVNTDSVSVSYFVCVCVCVCVWPLTSVCIPWNQ